MIRHVIILAIFLGLFSGLSGQKILDFNQFFFVEDDFSARANLFFYTVIVDDQVLKSGKVLKQ